MFLVLLPPNFVLDPGDDLVDIVPAMNAGAVYFQLPPTTADLPAAVTAYKEVVIPAEESLGGTAYTTQRAADPQPGMTLGQAWPVGTDLDVQALTWRCATAAPEPGHPLLVALMALREAAVAGTRPWVARRLA